VTGGGRRPVASDERRVTRSYLALLIGAEQGAGLIPGSGARQDEKSSLSEFLGMVSIGEATENPKSGCL